MEKVEFETVLVEATKVPMVKVDRDMFPITRIRNFKSLSL